jgi:hypothetical protein
MRAFAAVPIAIVLCVAPRAFAEPRASVASARKAERRGEWRKALRHWKAAYNKEPNAEYLIGIGDAYAHLGNDSEARKNYEAYLADPLALASRIEKVKARLAELRPDVVALPAPLPLPSLSAAPSAAASKKDADPLLPLPERDPPAAAKAAPVQVPALPARIELPPAAPKEAPPAAAAESPRLPPKPILVVATPAENQTPLAAVSAAPVPPQPRAESGRAQRTMAYVTAGVAIAALGGGALAWSQAGSAHSELTSKIHTGADTQLLLENERRNRTLSLVGFAGGLLAAGIATALFAF